MYVVPKIELDDTMQEIRKLALQIRHKKAILKDEARINKQSRKPVVPRTVGAKLRERSVAKLRKGMENLGVDMSGTSTAHFTKTKQRARSTGPVAKRGRMDVDSDSRSFSKSRALVKPPRNEQGVRDVAMKNKLAKIAHRAISKKVGRMGLKGEADRFIGTKMPKHLFAGKRGAGKTDWR
jgi:nucleolar GTP-binding protein